MSLTKRLASRLRWSGSFSWLLYNRIIYLVHYIRYILTRTIFNKIARSWDIYHAYISLIFNFVWCTHMTSTDGLKIIYKMGSTSLQIAGGIMNDQQLSKIIAASLVRPSLLLKIIENPSRIFLPYNHINMYTNPRILSVLLAHTIPRCPD